MAPLTSICAPSRTSVRLPALTPTCPPVASVSESPWKSTVPPLSTCTSDRSRRYGSVCPQRLAGGQAGGHQGVALPVQRGGAVQVHQDGGGRAGTQRHRAVGADAVQMDGAARVHRSGRGQHAGLLDLARGQRDVAQRRQDQAAIAHRAYTRGRHFIAARGRGDVALGALAALDHEIVAGRQRRLALGRGDGAGIVDLAAQQQDVAAGLGHGRRTAGLDDRARTQLDLAQSIGETGRLAVRAVQAVVLELLVAEAWPRPPGCARSPARRRRTPRRCG